MTEIVTLRHGGDVPASLVTVIMISLDNLLKHEPVAFYELVQVCRDRSHVPYGNTGEKLRERGLLNGDGHPHDLTRDVVLSAARGDGGGLHLGSPLAEATS